MRKIDYQDTSYFVHHNTRYVFIDGNTCDTMEQCYRTLQEQLSIPEYFGNNLDALEEVLADLEWITEDKIQILLLNEAGFLSNAPEQKAAFLDILQTNDNDKINISFLGNRNNSET